MFELEFLELLPYVAVRCGYHFHSILEGPSVVLESFGGGENCVLNYWRHLVGGLHSVNEHQPLYSICGVNVYSLTA